MDGLKIRTLGPKSGITVGAAIAGNETYANSPKATPNRVSTMPVRQVRTLVCSPDIGSYGFCRHGRGKYFAVIPDVHGLGKIAGTRQDQDDFSISSTKGDICQLFHIG